MYGPLHNKTAVENFEKAIDEVKSQVILSHDIIVYFNYYLYRVEQLNMVARYVRTILTFIHVSIYPANIQSIYSSINNYISFLIPLGTILVLEYRLSWLLCRTYHSNRIITWCWYCTKRNICSHTICIEV